MSKETMIRRALIGISLAAVGAVWAGEEFNGYSLEQSRAFHKEWNLDDWDEGGPLMRYVFLNMSEFWNHSLIARGGQTRELQNESRDDVAAFVTSTARG
ncbi:MAG: hypothetical protein OEW59_06515, partial [Gammaproteobacteria bacterium]|nr:hypothetical protein [Gammaproteobacteria bacterium]